MTEASHPGESWIRQQALRFADRELPVRLTLWDDTTRFMSIDRDHLIDLQGGMFLVQCNERERRFGLVDDQPKFWVKRAVNLDSGRVHILKLVFQEEFRVRVGALQVSCTRSAEKEGRVLELVRGDARFMQGRTVLDSGGNLVRIIDYISGVDLLTYVQSVPMGHEEYVQERLPGILLRIRESCCALQRLHDAGLCHGDIRNDHILIEHESGDYKWIDFDLNQDTSGLDVWSLGNILHCVVAKGFVTFADALRLRPELSGNLGTQDASVFFPNRVMNLWKVYPYLPVKVNDILLRFSFGARACYDRPSQIADDLGDCVEATHWQQ